MQTAITCGIDTMRGNCVPSLPFELQFEILRQISPIQLFRLRRVSRAWNNMLSNPILLEEINQHLPYLTSAPNLTSRLKRRMRMVRREPVWVKPVTQVFPWIQNIYQGWAPFRIANTMKFWKGWGIFVQNLAQHIAGPGQPVRMAIKLRIEGLGKNMRAKHPRVVVDVWEDLKRIYPEECRRYFNFDENNIPVTWIKGMKLNCLQFLVEDGKVVVHLDGSGPNVGLAGEAFVFIYSIPTGTLVQHIHHVYAYRRAHESVEFFRASETSFMLCCVADEREFQNPEEAMFSIFTTSPSPTKALWVYLYSLHDGSLIRQIRIGFPKNMDHQDLEPKYSREWQYMSRIVKEMFQLDHLGRIWFSSCRKLPICVSYFESRQELQPLVSVPILDLPTVTSANVIWTIVPVVPPSLEKDKQINFHIGVEEYNELLLRYRLGSMHIHDNRICLLEERSENVPARGRSAHQTWLATLPTMNTTQIRTGENIFSQSEAFEVSKLTIHTYRARKVLNHDGSNPHVPIDPRNMHRIDTNTLLVRLQVSTWSLQHLRAAPWGIIVNSPMPGGDDWHKNDPNAASEIMMDYGVLPLHHDDVYYPGTCCMEHRATIPATQEEDSQSPNNSPLLSLEPNYSLAKVVFPDAWVDDGLFPWVVDLSDLAGNNRTELWLVCYEEEWAI